MIEKYLDDLAAAVADAKATPSDQPPKSGALYGLSGSGPEGVQAVEELLAGAIDAFYDVPGAMPAVR